MAEVANFQTIHNCYDSHTHFLATGETQAGLSLHFMKNEKDILQIKPQSHHYKGSWLVGFGWNHLNWSDPQWPHRRTLDQIFPDTPVFLSRIDGHSSWINTCALNEFKKMGLFLQPDPFVIHDAHGETGILKDAAHIAALIRLPALNTAQMKTYAAASMKYFNQNGITHLRDLSMTSALWSVLCDMQKASEMTVCIDSFITAESVSDLDRAYSEFEQCQKNPNPYLRIKGLKIFIDGSLGSQTAYLSQKYLNSESTGQLLWSPEDIATAVQFCWQRKIEIAIHTIGDEAVHQAALAARKISASGLEGRIHLEHVQLLRSETLSILKGLHVTVHMQPCHWISDQPWIEQVLPSILMKNLFSWEKLRKNKIKIHFGSDSPIEPVSLFRNYQAIHHKNKFFEKLNDNWIHYHQHPDSNWTQSKTILDVEHRIIREVIFDQKRII